MKEKYPLAYDDNALSCPYFMEELDNQDVCVEKALVFHDGLAFAGSGGGTKFTGKTEFENNLANGVKNDIYNKDA